MPDQAEYLRRVEEIADIVRADADEADRERRIGDKTIAALRDTGLLRMLVPEEYGGGGLTMSDTFAVADAMARVDGSTGWNLNIGAGGMSLAATLGDDAARDEVLGDPMTVIAGTLNFVLVSARRVDGGYVFDGRGTFMSGSAHANWFFLGGLLRDENGKPTFDNGAPVVVRGVTPAPSLPVLDTWRVSGMRATASNDAEIDNLFVPDRYICDPTRLGLRRDDPATRMPLLSRFGAGLAFVGLGAARGAIDALAAIAGDKVALGTTSPLRERVDVQIDVARAQGMIESGAAFVERTWDEAAARTVRREPIDIPTQAMLRLSYVTAAEQAAAAADLVCRAAGSSALFESAGIERCWRDAHAVTKHVMVSVRGYERVGRILLGLEPLPGIL